MYSSPRVMRAPDAPKNVSKYGYAAYNSSVSTIPAIRSITRVIPR